MQHCSPAAARGQDLERNPSSIRNRASSWRDRLSFAAAFTSAECSVFDNTSETFTRSPFAALFTLRTIVEKRLRDNPICHLTRMRNKCIMRVS